MTAPRMLLSGLTLLVVAAGALGCLVWAGQRSVLFPGVARSAPNAPKLPPGVVEALWLETPEGRVEAWYLPPPRPARQRASNLAFGADEASVVPAASPSFAPGMLFAHGNGELIDDWLHPMHLLSQLGLGILLVEYPGYGRSQGEPSQESIAQTMRAAYDTLAARDEIDASRIVAYGRSLGGGAVGTLMQEANGARPLAAAILQSTFTDVPALARSLLPVPAFLIRDPLDTLSAVRAFDAPILVAHGSRDEMIPFAHAKALNAAASRAELLTYDCGHNDFPPDWSRFVDDLRSFLSRNELLRPQVP